MQHCANKLGDWLQSRTLPWFLGALAMLLCAPSLWLGWRFDDEFHGQAQKSREESPLGGPSSRRPDRFVCVGLPPSAAWSLLGGGYLRTRTGTGTGRLGRWLRTMNRIA